MKLRGQLWFIVLIFAMGTVYPLHSEAKRRKRVQKKTVTVSADKLSAVRGVYQDLSESPDLNVRKAIILGKIELGGEDRIKAIEKSFVMSDLDIKLIAVNEVLDQPKKNKKYLKQTEKILLKLLESDDHKQRTIGLTLLNKYYKTKKRNAWIRKVMKTGTPAARRMARKRLMEGRDKGAWKIVNTGLKKGSGDEYDDALAELKQFPYKQAKSWALTHASDTDEAGEVARGWISKAGGRFADKMTQALVKQYHKADGNFPKRVRLAHLLSSRGKLKVVQKTLVVSVKDKKGLIDEDLDSKELRIMGWEGLKPCRDPEILKQVKPTMIVVKNREEAKPIVDWLADWVRDTRDPTAMKILEDMMQQTQFASRIEATRALGELKIRKSWPLIENALMNGNEDLRTVAATALSTMATKGDEKKFDRYLKKERSSLSVKEELLKGVSKIGTKETLSTIKYWLLTSREPTLRIIALQGVKRVRMTQSTLEKVLQRKLQNDPKLNIRIEVWELLLSSGSTKIKKKYKSAARWMNVSHIQRLSKNKKVPNDLFRHIAISGETDPIRLAALQVFIDRGEDALQDLIYVLNNSVEPAITVQVVFALRALLQDRGVKFYRKALKDDSGLVRAYAIDSIRMYGPTALTQLVRDLIENDRDPHARVQAARAFIALSRKALLEAPVDDKTSKKKKTSRKKKKSKKK